MNKDILQGLRVLDFTRVVAGPYATRLLADFGAEVIKIQTGKTAGGAEDNLTGYFNYWNRNKKGITLNMNNRKARELFLQLVAKSDAVVENFTPRVMANWGLDYNRLKEVKPEIITLSISGMGQTGPWKDFSAYGPTLQSLGGLTYLTSFSPEEPIGLGFSYADPMIGIYGAISILAALEYRDKTGKGQSIDLSGFEALCTLIGPALLEQSANKRDVLPAGNGAGHIPAAPYGCYRCRGTDKWCVIALFAEEQWHALCRVTEHPEWAEDERFLTLSKREENKKDLDVLLEVWTKKLDAEVAVQLLQDAGIPAGVVQDAEELASDLQLRARNFFVTLKHPLLGDTTSDTYPFKFPNRGTEGWRAAPLLGADNDYVFGKLLGLTEDAISRLKEEGAIA